ncbi:hypothetical protein F4X88_21815 [Candidatus Poribacteria bacterium]|nr:hypothetical protein [Candidatus Poribacteria bacterium]MYA58921.1 hypothetical protein [Candidatus Poribacteria bacterium]
MDLEPVLETIPKIIATQTAKLTYNYLASRVKERIERNWELMSKDMREKVDQGDPLRNDWFAENEVLNNRISFRLLEKTIREISNDSEERKSLHIAKFWVNICLTSNADIDQATAFSYFEAIESVSWRQLCIIRLIVLYGDHEVEIDPIDDEGQMPQDMQTSFYSISREYEKLMDDRYIDGASVPTNTKNKNPFVRNPGSGWLPENTRRLYSLMNLHEIPDGDIEQTFSIWNVRMIQTSG